MKFIVEFSVKAGDKNKVHQAFEQRGPNRNPGIDFRGAWIGKDADVVYALVESADESLVKNAAKSWTDLQLLRITPVIDVEQY